MGLLMYIIFALFFGAIGFGVSEFLHKKKAAAGGSNAGPGPSPAKSGKGGKGGKGGKSAKTQSAETAVSGTSSKKGGKKK